MKLAQPDADGGGGFSAFFAGLRTRRGGHAGEEADGRVMMARAVTAGAISGAVAGAVAGAAAAAATVDATRASRVDATPATPSGATVGGGAAASPPPLLDSPGYGEWQRAYDDGTGAWYYYSTLTRETTWTPPPGWVTHKASGSVAGGDHELDLARTLTLDDYLHKSGITQQLQQEEAVASPGALPSLYARDTDIDEHEEVDPRVGVALEEMNSAMCEVNDLEAALTQAKRKARQLEAEQKQLCQAAYDKLSRGVKEALPAYSRQVLAKQQLEKTQRAFTEYQRAHDLHADAKAAVAALEGRLMASSGGAVIDTELLGQYSDAASRVVDAESAKLRADHVHAVEARRLAMLARELQHAQRVSKDHAERAMQYLAIKSRAELVLQQAVERMHEVEQQLARAKRAYAAAMSSLDAISRDIHDRRQQSSQHPAQPPAVAAEQPSPVARGGGGGSGADADDTHSARS